LPSTSCDQIAREILEASIAGRPPAALPRALVEDPSGQALFGILVEGLADRFEPALGDIYARLFSQAVARVAPGVDAASLVARYERVRRPRPIAGEPRRVLVLSRVTLGADVAVTSVLMAAAQQRFPDAEVVFVGPHKNFELFAADARLGHAPIAYQRGGLAQRLAVWEELKALAAAPDSVVIDPDSRLTQLGLLPVGAEDRYHLFESRAYGAATSCALPELASAWAVETFGVPGMKPYVALAGVRQPSPGIAVSLGVGKNPSKRVPDPFEERLLRLLAAGGLPMTIDRGAGGEEAQRVERAVERSGTRPAMWDGSFAGFAAIIAASTLYVGYDSAGGHVAAACGVPLISIFAGHPVPRMFDRWRPVGERAAVIRVDQPAPLEVLARVQQAVAALAHAAL